MPAKQQAPEETPEQVIADAEAAIEEADRLAADLEQRVRDGDETVTLEDIKAAKDAGWFARLRKEAREKKAAELAAQREKDARAAIIAEHLPVIEGVRSRIEPLIAEAAAKIEEALRYADVANDSRKALLAVADAVHNPHYPEPDAFRRGGYIDPGALHHGGKVYRLLSARTVLAQLGERFGVRIDDDLDHITRYDR